jgi:hypothetical protein
MGVGENASFPEGEIDPLFMNNNYYQKKLQEFRWRYPKLSEEELRRMIIVENTGFRLRRLFQHKKHASAAEGFFMLNKNYLRSKHMRLTTMYMGKLLNSILTKQIEGFFMINKKMKFLEDVEMQRKVFSNPLETVSKMWARKAYGALNQLRIFNNIVNNYEYHIQPFQKRSLKNNIIGLLREMKLNNHRNQRIMLRDPKLLKRNLLLHITAKLIEGKAEQQMEEFFETVKGQDKELVEAGKKFKHLEFLLRGMMRTRYGWFFRDLVIHDRSVIDEMENRSNISRFTRNTVNGRRMRTHSDIDKTPPRNGNKVGVFGDNDPLLKNALSFENKGFQRGSADHDSHRVINSFYQDPRNGSYLKRSLDPNQMDYSTILDGNEMKLSMLKRNPGKYLSYILRRIFQKKKKQIFEYIKLLLMLKRLKQPNMTGEMTKSIINLRAKVNKEKALSFKLLAIILDRIFTYRSNEMKRQTMNILKDKEIQIYKVLFGKVTAVKPINPLTGDTQTQYNFPARSMANSNSYVNFQRPSHIEHLSINGNFKIIFYINSHITLQ